MGAFADIGAGDDPGSLRCDVDGWRDGTILNIILSPSAIATDVPQQTK